MDTSTLYLLAADITLFVHVSFVVFVVVGLLLIFLGKTFAWSWVRNRWFRLAHLAAIAIVVAQSWFGIICPLTTLEMSLRSRAGHSAYPGTFMSHWLEKILYYDAPAWIFAVCYTPFAALVVASWFWVRPHAKK